MEIIDYYTSGCQGHWLEKMKKSDWGAGQYLYELFKKGEMKKLCGDSTKVLLLLQEKYHSHAESGNLLDMADYSGSSTGEPLQTA